MDDVRLEARGLWLDPNELTTPAGAMREALNVRIRRANIIEPRPGFPFEEVTGASGGGWQILAWGGELYGVFGGELWRIDTPAEVTAGGSSLSITSSEAFGAPMGRCFYVTTDDGVYRIAEPGDVTAVLAGIAQGTLPEVSISPGPDPLDDGDQIAMRTLFSETINGQLLVGAPSDSFLFLNDSGSPRAMQVRIPLPDSVTAGMSVELYTTAPATAPASPGDEMFLAFSHVITAGNVTAGHVTELIGIAPRGASLYTNETQEGILQAAYAPPIAKCLAWWKNMAFYGDTSPQPGYFLRGQVTRDDTVGYSSEFTATATIGSPTLTVVTYTSGYPVLAGAYVKLNTQPFAGSADAALPAFARVVSTTPTTITLDQNALSSTGGAFHGFGVLTVGAVEYIVGAEDDYANDQFGTLQSLGALLDAAGVVRLSADFTDALPAIEWTSDAAFSVSYVGRSIGWGGIYGTTTVAAASNSTNATPSRVAWSKTLQPEAVPLLQYQDVGDWRQPVMRLIPTRDSLFVLKADGVWRITGDSPDSLRFEEFDRSIKLIHRRCADAHENRVWAWTTAGIVALSEAGVERMSEPSIKVAIDAQQANVAMHPDVGGAFVTGCTAQNCVLVGVPATDATTDDDTSEYVYVYESNTNAWVRWVAPYQFRGALERNDAIVGVTGENLVMYQSADCVDIVEDVTVVSVAEDGTWAEIELPDDAAGYRITQGSDVAWVTSERAGTPDLWNVTAPLSVGAAVAAVWVWCEVTWCAPATSGVLVHWRQLRAQFSSLVQAWRVRFGFTSERVHTESSVYVDFPDPTAEKGVSALRVFVTRACARAARLRPTMRVISAGQQWTLEGVSLTGSPMRDGDRLP